MLDLTKNSKTYEMMDVAIPSFLGQNLPKTTFRKYTKKSADYEKLFSMSIRNRHEAGSTVWAQFGEFREVLQHNYYYPIQAIILYSVHY